MKSQPHNRESQSSRGVLPPGTYKAVIPVHALRCAPDARERWKDHWLDFRASGDWGLWGRDFEAIARECGFNTWKGKGGYFAEAQVARELQKQGYRVFHGPRLFPYGKQIGIGLDDKIVIEANLAKAGLPRPDDFRKRITPQPRNPDLAAYRRGRPWRFVEAKQREDITDGQLVALAILRKLLGAQVEVVRVVPEGTSVEEHSGCRYIVEP